MSDEIERRLRAALSAPPLPDTDLEERARIAAVAAVPRPRRWARRMLRVGIPALGIAALGLLVLALPRGSDTPETERPASLVAVADPAARESAGPDTAFQWDPTPRGGGASFEAGTLRDLLGAVTILVFADSPGQVGDAEWYASAGLAPVVTVSPGDLGSATRLRPPRATYATASDAGGALAHALGVTSRPTTVVLDKAGRVALRTPGSPTRADPGMVTDLRAALASLRAEPKPTAVERPGPPPVWFLAGDPLPSSAVPADVISAAPCRMVPSRVWGFGPTATGWRVFVGIAAVGPAVRELVFVGVDPSGSPVGGGLGCGLRPDFARRAQDLPAVEVRQRRRADGTDERVYLVRRGYVRAEAGGRIFPVVNGALSLSGHLPPMFTLIGPAGRRTVGLDVGLG